jgi:hypothetical protein
LCCYLKKSAGYGSLSTDAVEKVLITAGKGFQGTESWEQIAICPIFEQRLAWVIVIIYDVYGMRDFFGLIGLTFFAGQSIVKIIFRMRET